MLENQLQNDEELLKYIKDLKKKDFNKFDSIFNTVNISNITIKDISPSSIKHFISLINRFLAVSNKKCGGLSKVIPGETSFYRLHINRINESDLTKPIYVYKLETEKYILLDGLHRVIKACVEGIDFLPVKIISLKNIKEINEIINRIN